MDDRHPATHPSGQRVSTEFAICPVLFCSVLFCFVFSSPLLPPRNPPQILPKALIRRTKTERADDLALPPRRLVLRLDSLDEKELDFYEAMYTQSQASFNTFVSDGTLLHNYAHIFDLLIRLRQAVNHPYLVLHSGGGKQVHMQGQEQLAGEKSSGKHRAAKERQRFQKHALRAPDAVPGVNPRFRFPFFFSSSFCCLSPPGPASTNACCGLCHDPPEDAIVAQCGDIFCRVCIEEFLEAAGGTGEEAGSTKRKRGAAVLKCPICADKLTVDMRAGKCNASKGSGLGLLEERL